MHTVVNTLEHLFSAYCLAQDRKAQKEVQLGAGMVQWMRACCAPVRACCAPVRA